MADQNMILGLLGAADGPLTIVALASIAPRGKVGIQAHRKSILQAAATLVERKFARRFEGEHGRDFDGAAWEITAAGRAFLRTGKKIVSGQGNLNVPRHPSDGSLRERLWRALRIKTRATIPQLLAMVRHDADGENIARNAQAFLQRLVWAGVVVTPRQRVASPVNGSTGHKLFYLVRDLGPQAPVAHRDFLFDPNTRQHLPYDERPAREASL